MSPWGMQRPRSPARPIERMRQTMGLARECGTRALDQPLAPSPASGHILWQPCPATPSTQLIRYMFNWLTSTALPLTRWRPRQGGTTPLSTGTGRAGATIPASLTIDGVERRFGERLALAHVSLDIAPGEVMALLGPSGCGKSTLLRIAAGVERPTGGRVLLDGEEVAGPQAFVPPEARGVGLMFQDFALFPHLSIGENVAFGLKRLSREEARAVALATLERVGLRNRFDDYPHNLSGGEQQRVALARAIAPRPRVLLMDEPFSGLDVQLRERIRDEAIAIVRETGITCVLVTHDPEEALLVADRIAVMAAGRLCQVGTAQHLYEQPNDLFVARFFSDVNELPGTVSAGQIETAFGPIVARDVPEGTRATVCIRHRGVRVEPIGPQGVPLAMLSSGLPGADTVRPGKTMGCAGNDVACKLTQPRAGRVMNVQFLGDFAAVDLRVDGIDAILRARLRSIAAPPRGRDVMVSLIPGAVLVFLDAVHGDVSLGGAETTQLGADDVAAREEREDVLRPPAEAAE